MSSPSQSQGSSEDDSSSERGPTSIVRDFMNYVNPFHGNREKLSVPEPHDDGASESETLIDCQEEESPPVRSHGKVEEQHAEDDIERFKNIKEFTKRRDVERIIEEAIFERNRANRAEEENAQDRANYLEAERKRIEKIQNSSEAYAKANRRGDPQPPTLDCPNRHYLHTNLVDRLRECTVHITLRRSWRYYYVDDFVRAEEHALQALKYAKDAKGLNYKPLAAYCHFMVGKTQSKQGKFEEAMRSFEDAKPAIGLYVEWDELKGWKDAAEKANVREMNGSEPTHSARSNFSFRSIESQSSAASVEALN